MENPKMPNEQSSNQNWRTACAVFPDRPAAEKAIDELIRDGVDRSNISVVMRSAGETKEVAEATGTHAGQGAGTGAGIGVVAGGAAGILAGLGLLAIPGIGPLLAVGPIIAGITGAVGGGVLGGIVGVLIGAGIPEREARAYEERVRAGGVLVTARCSGDCDKVMSTMQNMGADMSSCTSPDWTPSSGEHPYDMPPTGP